MLLINLVERSKNDMFYLLTLSNYANTQLFNLRISLYNYHQAIENNLQTYNWAKMYCAL